MARGRGAAKKRSGTRSEVVIPPKKLTKTPPPPVVETAPQEQTHKETGGTPYAAAAAQAPTAAWKAGQRASSAAGSSAANASGTAMNAHIGQGAGKVGTLGEWQRGTSVNEMDFGPPQSVETPEHLAIICPPAHQKLIQEGSYVNLASFIPKEPLEERSTMLEWSFSEGAMKQTSNPRQVKNIEEWTNAFARFAGISVRSIP